LIIVQNHYYAAAGKRETVLATRLRADACRRSLGLDSGRTLTLVQSTGTAPAVIWQSSFASLQGWHEDLRILAESAEFADIRREQGQQLDAFARCGYVVAGASRGDDARG